jgi:hypothetical protein
MPLFEINTISLFRHKYVIEAKNLEHAYDTVLVDRPEELTQKHLDEIIIDGQKIGKKEFDKLCHKSLHDIRESSNAHLGKEMIYKVNYSES